MTVREDPGLAILLDEAAAAMRLAFYKARGIKQPHYWKELDEGSRQAWRDALQAALNAVGWKP